MLKFIFILIFVWIYVGGALAQPQSSLSQAQAASTQLQSPSLQVQAPLSQLQSPASQVQPPSTGFLQNMLNHMPISNRKRVYLDIGQARVKKSKLALPAIVYQGLTGTNRTNGSATTNTNTSKTTNASAANRPASPGGIGTTNSTTGTPSQLALGQQLWQVIENNLKASFLFELIEANAFIEDVSQVGLKPLEKMAGGFRFDSWRSIGADFLIRCAYTLDAQNNLLFKAYLYNVQQRAQVFYKEYKAASSSARKIGHLFSNDVVLYLTGSKGWFNSRLVVTKSQRLGAAKEVWVMDWDAQRQQKITRQGLAISPAWSPQGDVVAYTAFSTHRRGGKNLGRNVDLYAYNLKTKKKAVLSYAKGINSGAAFFNNPLRGLLFTRTSKGAKSSDIYQMSLDGKKLKALTKGPFGAMNVEPAVSPDDKWIAFSSDRGSRPMIYVMAVKGAGADVSVEPAKPVTFAGVYNSSPSWSPDAKKIAFAGLDKSRGVFDIFVVDRDGRNLKRLTSAKKQGGRWANNEAPVFTPSSKHILFVSDRTGHKQLYLTDVHGHDLHRVTHDTAHYEKPKFSTR